MPQPGMAKASSVIMPQPGMAKASSVTHVCPVRAFVRPNILLIEITLKVFDLGFSTIHQRCISIWPWWSLPISDLDLFLKVTGQFQWFVHFGLTGKTQGIWLS